MEIIVQPDTATEKYPDKNFEHRSDIAQEIITHNPDFFNRWAMLLFIILFALLVTSTWFVKYPDIISSTAVLSSNNAPKGIVPKQTGKIVSLFAQNNQSVSQNQTLAWIESNADMKEVIDLSSRLDSATKMMQGESPRSAAKLFNKHFFNLGEIQEAYQVFITSLQQYDDYLINGYYVKRKSMLSDDIVSLQNIRLQLLSEKELANEDIKLSKTTFEMNNKLFEDKIISAEEFRKAQRDFLYKQQVIPKLDANLMSQQNQIRDKQKEIHQLEHDISQQQQIFEQSLQTLKSRVNEWLDRHTIRSPTTGKVVYTIPLQQNQYVEAGKLLGYINSPDNKYYAELRIPQHNFGKVDSGMKVHLRFDAYPYQEYGFVKGTLNYLSSVAVDSVFLGTVLLDEGLITSQRINIPYKSGLKARALVVTNEMRLLQRLYYSIIKSSSVQ